MLWNWELPDWPHFHYDSTQIIKKERTFILNLGKVWGCLKNTSQEAYHQFVIEILSTEGLESFKIEGEILDRESLQISIKREFGLIPPKQETNKESCMAALLCQVYESFHKPLSHEMLWEWHAQLFDQPSFMRKRGYRSHPEPMQIISHRYGDPRVFFEAPPSARIFDEMQTFINWFNASLASESVLGRAAIAHVYFESIHPFEDGNGRIGRLIIEKALSQAVDQPILMAVSKILEKRKKEYYTALDKCNRTLKVDRWVHFFADVVLQAQEEASHLLEFLIEKSKLMNDFSGQLNPRQEKVLMRMFAEGIGGFKGGLSAEKYITITKTSRATATRDLADLVEKKALVKTGELRHTRYWLNLKFGHPKDRL